MARSCNIKTELIELRAVLQAHFGGPVDCPLLSAAEKAHADYERASSLPIPQGATVALERLCLATNSLHSELADGDKPGTRHCVNIINFIHPEEPVLREVKLSWV